MRRDTLVRGIADGLINAILLFVLGEYCVSKFAGESYVGILYATIVCTGLSIAVSFPITYYTKGNMLGYYIVGRIVFLLSGGLVLLNYLYLHFHIFPLRDLGNADGLVVIFAQGCYLLFSESIRFAFCLAAALNKKLSNKTS